MKKGIRIFLALVILSAISSLVVIAHGDGDGHDEDLAAMDPNTYLPLPLWDAVIAATAILALFTFISVELKGKLSEEAKKIIFIVLAVTMITSTLYLVGATVYLNMISETGGPVHWHADYEIWDCGKQISLHEPESMSNKVGTSVIHEHNDNRIHVEGVLIDKSHASLSSFFTAVGGLLSDTAFLVPTDDGR